MRKVGHSPSCLRFSNVSSFTALPNRSWAEIRGLYRVICKRCADKTLLMTWVDNTKSKYRHVSMRVEQWTSSRCNYRSTCSHLGDKPRSVFDDAGVKRHASLPHSSMKSPLYHFPLFSNRVIRLGMFKKRMADIVSSHWHYTGTLCGRYGCGRYCLWPISSFPISCPSTFC